jgi:hypothetical protein
MKASTDKSRLASAVIVRIASLPLLLLAACGGPSVAESSTSVGALNGTDAALGIVRFEKKIVAYVSGGPTTYATHSRWFAGKIDARTVTLEKDGWSLAIDMYDEAALGTLTAPGATSSLTFDTDPRIAGTLAGVYGASESACGAGVVVLQPSPMDMPIVRGTWCDADGRIAPIEPASPPTAEDSTLVVQVTRPDGPPAALVLQRATP